MRLPFLGIGFVALTLFVTRPAAAADEAPAGSSAAPVEAPPAPAVAPADAPLAAPSPSSPAVPSPPPVARATSAPALSFATPTSCNELPDGCPPAAPVAPVAPVAAAERARAPMDWYGHQTLIMDGVTLGIGVMSLAAKTAEGAIATAVLYGAGGPLVHIGNGHPWMALASLATRASAPAVGGATGALIGLAAGPRDSHGSSVGPLAGLAVGTLTGVLTAVVLDAAVYAREKRTPAPAWDGKPIVAPHASITPTGGSVGLGGAF